MFEKEIKLYMFFDALGDTVRTGPLLWHINRKRTEDVKNHILDLLFMLRILRNYLPKNLDFSLMEDYIICHDLPEVITGDITKFEGVSDEEIAHVTCLAIDYIHEFFSGTMNFKQLITNYEARNDIEAKTVHMLDKIQSAIPFMKYQLEGCIDIDNTDIPYDLRNHPFIVEEVEKGHDLADVFYFWHRKAISITDEECVKYGITREYADEIIRVIANFFSELYEAKKNNNLLVDYTDFPEEATTHNRNIKRIC